MWMKIDDGLHAHRKTRAVTKSGNSKKRDSAPMGMWVLAGSWAAQNGTDGWVPEDELDRWDSEWEALAHRLVKAGYWWPAERDGEAGYGFNDWLDYNPESEAASKSGTFGNHVRWHTNRGRVDPECEHCPQEPRRPESAPDIAPDSGGDRGAIVPSDGLARGLDAPGPVETASPQVRGPVSGGESGGESGRTSGRIALPDPIPTPTRPDPVPVTSAIAERRDDVERICTHLADRIEGNGSKRPNIGKGWLDAARLMLDRDGRAEADIHRAIDWCQDDTFWRGNVLSMPTLREKYDQLRLQAARSTTPTGKPDTDGIFNRAAIRMGVVQ